MLRSRTFILSLVAGSCLGAALALAQTTPSSPPAASSPTAPAPATPSATPAPVPAPAAPAAQPAPAQSSAPSNAMTDVSKWTRKEWNAAKAKWVHEKKKWHDCNGQAKAQKLTGRQSWQFLYDCMTKS